ncbi:MAG TPA: hypothetical protein VLZ05_00080 [Mycobacterium sp.]|nr:hypothetical protein [Mycobacterium sp.]HUH67418.1 hypothetical protein [Mycobacterium sp.]
MGQSRSDETGRAIMALTDFRAGLYRCWTSWPDAAFELTDTVLCMPSPVASVPALSLEPAFRRSHGSLYKALARGEVDGEAMRDGGDGRLCPARPARGLCRRLGREVSLSCAVSSRTFWSR